MKTIIKKFGNVFNHEIIKFVSIEEDLNNKTAQSLILFDFINKNKLEKGKDYFYEGSELPKNLYLNEKYYKDFKECLVVKQMKMSAWIGYVNIREYYERDLKCYVNWFRFVQYFCKNHPEIEMGRDLKKEQNPKTRVMNFYLKEEFFEKFTKFLNDYYETR